jgi:hypothetical protein
VSSNGTGRLSYLRARAVPLLHRASSAQMALRLYFKLDELGAQLKPALHPEASDRYAVAEDHEVGYLVNQGIVSKSCEDCHHLVGYITSAPPSGIGARCEMAKDSRSHPIPTETRKRQLAMR